MQRERATQEEPTKRRHWFIVSKTSHCARRFMEPRRKGIRTVQGGTHGSVDGLVPLEVPIVPEPVVRLSERNARKTPRRKAEINGTEAPKQVRIPRLRIVGRFGVEDFAGLREDVVGAADPLLDLVVVDGSLLGWLLGGHCDVDVLKGKKSESCLLKGVFVKRKGCLNGIVRKRRNRSEAGQGATAENERRQRVAYGGALLQILIQ